jgi:hypothetical protein
MITKLDDRLKKFRERMFASVTETALSKGGLNVLRYLYSESGLHSRSVVIGKSGSVDLQATMHNISRCDTYKDIRQFMTPEVIKLVELDLANETEKPKTEEEK